MFPQRDQKAARKHKVLIAQLSYSSFRKEPLRVSIPMGHMLILRPITGAQERASVIGQVFVMCLGWEELESSL